MPISITQNTTTKDLAFSMWRGLQSLTAVMKQTITYANFDPDLCHEMALLCQNVL